MEEALGALAQNPVERYIEPNIAGHVVTVDPQYLSGTQPIAQIYNRGIVQQDIDVGGEDKPPACAPNTYVFPDHLKEGQLGRMRETRVNFRRDRDDPNHDATWVVRPLQRICERQSPRWRIPLDQDQLGVELMPAALRNEAVDEMLHAAAQIAAMIVVARDRDDAQV
jgi:hypothetical protein